MKKIIALLTIFFLFTYSVYSIKVFEIEETEKISLKPQAEDPDDDLLTYTYEEPLDSNGEWQTDYGDAGDYNTSITVSDGENAVSEEILIIVYRKEEKPVIEASSPEDTLIEIKENEEVVFSVKASDLNNDELTYRWTIDGVFVSDSNSFTYNPGYDSAGTHSIALFVSDGRETISDGWSVSVEDVDVDSLFESIRDRNFVELDEVSLEIPDFESYGLSYEISDPIGDDNSWQTGYDDEGVYDVTVFVKGNEYDRKKTVQVVVGNKDRPPRIGEVETFYVDENEEIELMLSVFDEDGDDVVFSAENLPENAFFEDDTFIWMPSFDTVQKEGLFDSILEKFRLLSKTHEVEFIALSNDLEDRKKVKVVIRDVNQPFELSPIGPIVVKEGEDVIIEPSYVDPDGDEVRFEYSGFMIGPQRRTSFTDAGHYVVKVRATDGYYAQTVFVDVIIEDVNRAPEFDEIPTRVVKENEEVRVKLHAEDPDNTEVMFFSNNLPEKAYILDDELVWFATAAANEREFVFEVVATDGVEEVVREARIIVEQVNMPPKIVSSSNTQVSSLGDTTTFEVEVFDEDGDKLTYTWDFGLFDTLENGENVHNRRFSSKGDKKVTVTVSDGEFEVSKTWKVLVI